MTTEPKQPSAEQYQDRDIIFAAVQAQPNIFPTLPAVFLNDKEIALIALVYNGNHLRCVSHDLKKDADICRAAILESPLALQYSPWACGNREMVEFAVGEHPIALRFADPKFKADEKLVMLAVTQHGQALQYAHPELQNNRCVVEAAVRNNSISYQFASEDLRNDPHVLQMALEPLLYGATDNSLALNFESIPEKLRTELRPHIAHLLMEFPEQRVHRHRLATKALIAQHVHHQLKTQKTAIVIPQLALTESHVQKLLFAKPRI